MSIFVKVKQRSYQDSLKLMRISSDIQSIDGITQAFAFMGTEINKSTRIPAGALTGEAAAAGPDDLIIMIECDDATTASDVLSKFDEMIASSSPVSSGSGLTTTRPPMTLDEAVTEAPEANIAIISVPGQYAAAQAMRALQLGLNVHLFSDNVTLEDELRLKEFAVKKGLLLMGPDCGTAIIQGTPLCFANEVRKGEIGIIAASGTGAQEVSCIIDALGGGISHIIGVGGRDLSQDIGGIMTLHAIQLMAHDPSTKVIAIVSKPPAKAVADKVLAAIKAAGKPTVLIFMGFKSDEPVYAKTLEEGAAKAVALLKGEHTTGVAFPRKPVLSCPLFPGQTIIRGLYTGGTLASEAEYILAENGISSCEVIDLGGDEYTRGALHPMIDPTNRSAMAAKAAEDPATAVILCDVVIGHGSHHNPAGELAKAVEGSKTYVFASVTGTDADPQNKSQQERILRDAGIIVFPSNQSAVEACCALLKE